MRGWNRLVCPKCGATHAGRPAQVGMAPAPLSGHIPRDTPTPAPRREVGPGRPELVAASAVRAALREEQARSKRLRRAIVLVTLLLVGLAALVVLPLGTLLVLSITGTPL